MLLQIRAALVIGTASSGNVLARGTSGVHVILANDMESPLVREVVAQINSLLDQDRGANGRGRIMQQEAEATRVVIVYDYGRGRRSEASVDGW